MKTLHLLPASKSVATPGATRGRSSSRILVALLLAAGTAGSALAFNLDKLGDIQSKAEKVKRNADAAGKVAKGATGLSLEEEIAIGDAVAVQIVSRFGGVWRDATATQRVNVLGRGLARYAQRQDLEWRFGLLNTDQINAFSAPGGRVFITRGLYKILASDDELAGALGHEVEHVDRRHALKTIASGEALGGAVALVKENTRAGSNVAQFDDVITQIVDNLLNKGYDPAAEFDADKYGRELARTCGFAPGGLRAVIEKLQAKGDRESGAFSTHPPASARLQKLPKEPAK